MDSSLTFDWINPMKLNFDSCFLYSVIPYIIYIERYAEVWTEGDNIYNNILLAKMWFLRACVKKLITLLSRI